MTSEPERLKSDNPAENPYDPISQPLLTYVPLFSTAYWIIAWFIFATSVAFLFLLPEALFITLLATLSTALALMRSVLASRRVNELKLEDERTRIREEPATFYISSLVFGALTAIASTIGFVCVCFPGGLVLVFGGLNRSNVPGVCLLFVSAVAGLFVGYLCLSATVTGRNLLAKDVNSDSDPTESER